MREAEIILGALQFLLDHHAEKIEGYDPTSARKARNYSTDIAEILHYEPEAPPPPPAPAAQPETAMPAAQAETAMPAQAEY